MEAPIRDYAVSYIVSFYAPEDLIPDLDNLTAMIREMDAHHPWDAGCEANGDRRESIGSVEYEGPPRRGVMLVDYGRVDIYTFVVTPSDSPMTLQDALRYNDYANEHGDLMRRNGAKPPDMLEMKFRIWLRGV